MHNYHIIISVQGTGQRKPLYEFTPNYIFQRLPQHKPASNYPQNSVSHAEKRDYRFGPLRIDWMDFEIAARKPSISIGKEKERGTGPTEATFVPRSRSKSGHTNLPEGIIHIFRGTGNRPTPEELAAKAPDVLESEELDGVTLGVLAVPSWMTPSDFLTFIGPAIESVAHLRIVRDFAPNRSIALVRFTNPADAAEFAEVYNGKPFNSMEPEICHVVHVLSVQIESDDTLSQSISRISSIYGPAQELPTCPVCLERMDSAVTGLITVPCSHTFHCMCLSKWGDSRCPVCRYSQNLLTSHPSPATNRTSRPLPFASASTPTSSVCSECPSTTNLWICLVCGNIGCGRYGRAHAHAHYQATTHLYALELETQRVWDYAGDGYVHRLIQNKADGKLVELPSAASSMGTASREGGVGPSQADALSAEKIEAIGIEYSYLLTSQLDSQRMYYEEQNAELKIQLDELKNIVEQMKHEIEVDRASSRDEEKRKEKETATQIEVLETGKAKAEQKASRMADLARKLEKELKEEKAVSDGLMDNIKAMKDRLDTAEQGKDEHMQKIQELQDQVRDLMFFLDAQTKIEKGTGAEAEAAGGTIEVVEGTSVNSKNKKKKGKQRQ